MTRRPLALALALALAFGVAGCSSSPLPGGGDGSTPTDLSTRADLSTSKLDLSASGSDGGAAAGCIQSGGSVQMGLCCGASADFPDTCGIGACSCAPSSSHMIMECICSGTKCFDGTRCM